MLSGGRLSYLEIGGVIVAAALLAITFGRLATNGSLSSGQPTEHQYSYAEEYNGVFRAWAPTPYGKPQKPDEYTFDCAHPKDHDEADLCQQWRAAKAAEKAAAIAETQTYWNWVQLVGILATVAAAWAAAIAARAAQSSVAVAQDNAKKELRAYLSLIPGTISFDGLRPLSVDFVVKNHGTTPASEVVRFMAVLFPPYPLPPIFDPGRPGEGTSTNAVWPDMPVPAKRPLGNPLTKELLDDLRADRRRLCLLGLIRYRDVFEAPHYTKLCASFPWQQVINSLPPEGTINAPPRIVEIEWDLEEQHNDFD